MLSEFSIAAAESVLCHSSVMLTAKPGTHIAALVDTLTGFNESGSNTELYNTSVHGGMPPGAHSRIVDDITTQVANIMRTAIDLSTNVVNPLAAKCLQEIQVSIDENLLDNIGLLGNIKQVTMPELFLDPMFTTLIEPCRNSMTDTVDKSSNLIKMVTEDLTNEEIQLLIQTGSEGLDRKAAAYIGDTSLSDRMYFDISFSKLPLRSAAVLFFVFNGLLNRRFDKCEAILQAGDNLVTATAIKMAAGALLYSKLALYDTAISRGDIVAVDDFGRIDPNAISSRITYVYNQNYLAWIRDGGGSPEALLGYKRTTNDVSIFTMNTELRARPAEWKEKYLKEYNHAATLSRLENVRIVKSTTRRLVRNYIDLMENVDCTALYLRLEKALEHDYYGEKDNYHFIVSIITKTLFEGDTVKRLLLLVDSMLSEQGPNEANMEKAVYLAVKEVLAMWIADQVTVK